MGTQLTRKFHCSIYLTAILLCCQCSNGEKKTLTASERANVTLQVEDSQQDARIVWTFGPECPNIRIATLKKSGKREGKSDYDQRFRDRLHLDHHTGSLTITQLRMSDSGFYEFQSISTSIQTTDFHLTVYSLVSVPSITISSGSSSPILVRCSATNSRGLVLSWYKGRERLKNISSPELSSRLTLHLEIDSEYKDHYSCVAENPVEKMIIKLPTRNFSLGTTGNGSWCQTEAAARLVISAVLSLVLILLMVDHIILTCCKR